MIFQVLTSAECLFSQRAGWFVKPEDITIEKYSQGSSFTFPISWKVYPKKCSECLILNQSSTQKQTKMMNCDFMVHFYKFV